MLKRHNKNKENGEITVTSVKLISLLFTYKDSMVSHAGITGASFGAKEKKITIARFNLLLKMCIDAQHILYYVYAHMVIHGFDTVNRSASETSSGCVGVCVVQDNDLTSLMLISKV